MIEIDDIMNGLNPSQREAVAYLDGPQLVIAGAGSGKTRVLTYKIAYLIRTGMQPWKILALTFTNKAANEMKERIAQLAGVESASRLNMGTFHSVFAKILRVESGLLGFTSDYTIYDEADAKNLVKTIIKEFQLDEKQYKPASVLHRISMMKNRLVLPAQYAADGEVQQRDALNGVPAIAQIYREYQLRLHRSNAMDFDDLLVQTYLLLRDHPDVLRKYVERFDYVLVDEYQDTNYVQQQILLLLTRERQRICVVGDDYQSIYAFRGANVDHILKFQTEYNDARLFKLERNYRSTRLIVAAANNLMKHNSAQIPKEVYSEGDEGEKIQLKQAYSEQEEAIIVCKEIDRIKRQEQRKYADFAILYRTHAQSRTFEEEMIRRQMPYRIYGGQSFYQRKEIKDILAYFRLVQNPHDEASLKRIINYPTRGIGQTTVNRISEVARENSVSCWSVIRNLLAYPELNINRGTLLKINNFANLIQGFIEKKDELNALEIGQEILQTSGVIADLQQGKDADDLTRQENLDEFLASLQSFVDMRTEEGRGAETRLADYLQEVALLTDLDSMDKSDDHVHLMTVHAAKGLEFYTVFVVGMEENIFPSSLSIESRRELEEERRLFYVAITRAEQHCFLTYANRRYRYGKPEENKPSRFLKDIGEDLLDMDRPLNTRSRGFNATNDASFFYPNQRNSRWQNANPVGSQFRAEPRKKITAPVKPEKPAEVFSPAFKKKLDEANGRRLRRITPSSAPSASSGKALLKVGDRIEHERFGVGEVLAVEGTGENTKATVRFRNAGDKQLLLKFARYKLL